MAPLHFGYLRPAGIKSLDELVNGIDNVLACARQNGVGKVLLNTQDIYGFDSPDIVSRYYFIRQWARSSGGIVRLALVARPEMIDPEKFGVKVARGAGMVADIFESEIEAAMWLDYGER
jgi:hypothetical protein